MDNVLTKKIQEWLNASPEKQDIATGAMYLLQCNRNKVLYQNILRKPEQLKQKLIYELNKHLSYRLDGLTIDAVKAMDKEVVAKVVKTIKAEPQKGKRQDHDKLPVDIQQLFIDAHDIMVSMRSIHEKLKLMKESRPCDRYTFLKELIKAYDEYCDKLNRYDSYDINNPESKEVDAEKIEKAYETYRGYVVTNIKKLKAMPKGDKADRLRQKMQIRFDECKSAGVDFSNESLEQLKEIGIE